MSEERQVNLVLVGLEEGPDSKRKFIEGMAQRFKLSEAKVMQILGRLPFVLSRNCSLDEARALAEKVQAVGGLCRLQDPSEEGSGPERQQPPAAEPEAPEEPATEPEAASPEPAEVPEAPPSDERGKDDGYAFDLPPMGSTPISQEPQEAIDPKPEPRPRPKPRPEPAPARAAGTIPLAVPGVPTGKLGEGQVRCIECGEVQPPGATCRACYFPLPEK